MNDDLISRSALLEDIETMSICFSGIRSGKNVYYEFSKYFRDSVLKRIEEAPAVDAVEVVRCKDCAVPHNKWTGCPNLNGLVPPQEHFCRYGERRTDEQ